MMKRDFLRELDFTRGELEGLLELALGLKQDKQGGLEVKRLGGKNLCLIFEKTSTRTRCAFEVAASDQGAQVTYLDPTSSQLGHKESVRDSAEVLSRFYDCLVYRGNRHEDLETLAQYSRVPVVNALTDLWHPTQILADLLTIQEHCGAKALQEVSLSYLGDARYNMGRSLLAAGTIMGMDMRIIAPRRLWPDAELVAKCQQLSDESGAVLTVTDDLGAVQECDFVYTDVWVSMGEAKEAWAERIGELLPYRVNQGVLDRAGATARFLHCLPSYHDLNTQVGQEIYQTYGLVGVEVDDEVFYGEQSLVFEQAENRMHTIKAVLVDLLGE